MAEGVPRQGVRYWDSDLKEFNIALPCRQAWRIAGDTDNLYIGSLRPGSSWHVIS
ncbi:UNVERIFIED_CONTAM: hypothetical protein Slati_2942800 [Sesamum latifolium]|uniref:Uncharacterized protein n=1 Tax=Sesamum latifolium TaxID=2727402 RepID=A0AAW2VHC6_9LAMI